MQRALVARSLLRPLRRGTGKRGAVDDLEKRVAALEARLDRLDPHIKRSIPIGPSPAADRELEGRREAEFKQIVEHLAKEPPPVDRDQMQLVDGRPVPEDHSHTKLKDNGQQQDYVVLTVEERAKGFVRPVRRSYRHAGASGPRYPLRDLTEEEHQRYDQFGYIQYEAYPESDSSCVGRYWTQAQLDAIGKGCGTVTTMAPPIAETYARDPQFYGGTFCMGCRKHLPVDEFVWEGTTERVGS